MPRPLVVEMFINHKVKGDSININTLTANIKHLDPSAKPATSDAERDYFRHYGINFEEHCAGVSHHFGHFVSDRFDIVAHFFEHKKAVASCFIVHGYYDHAGLYSHLIQYCLKRRFSVVIFDLPGHGLSTGEPASISSFADYQSVLKDVLSVFAATAPRPWHAIGQSTGAAILMDFLLSGNQLPNNKISDNKEVFSKTVLLAPLLRPKKWIISAISHRVVTLLGIKKIRRHFAINSHDLEFMAFLKNNDPLQSKYLPLQWVSALKHRIKYFFSLPPTEYVPLIIQGKQDETVDWQYNLPAVQRKFPKAKVFYLKDGRHQLANESEDIREPMCSAMDVYFDVFNPE